MNAIYKMHRNVKVPYVLLRRQLDKIVREARAQKSRKKNIKQSVVEFALQHQKPAFVLWVAVTYGPSFYVAPIFRQRPYTIKKDGLRLEIRFAIDNFPCSYAKARLGKSGQSPGEFQRLLFGSPRGFGEFTVRVFTTSEAAWQSRNPRPIDPAKDI